MAQWEREVELPEEREEWLVAVGETGTSGAGGACRGGGNKGDGGDRGSSRGLGRSLSNDGRLPPMICDE